MANAAGAVLPWNHRSYLRVAVPAERPQGTFGGSRWPGYWPAPSPSSASWFGFCLPCSAS